MRRRTLVLLMAIAIALPYAGSLAFAQGDAKKEAPPAAPAPAFKVGDMAPDFTMIDQNRQKVQLSSFKGKKNVALAFVVFAFTPG